MKVRSKFVYVCHPFSGNIVKNQQIITEICENIASKGMIPLAPQLFLPLFVSEATQRKEAMDMCIEIGKKCDEIWVVGMYLSEGTAQEIAAFIQDNTWMRLRFKQYSDFGIEVS
jgi:hypothetical protein